MVSLEGDGSIPSHPKYKDSIVSNHTDNPSEKEDSKLGNLHKSSAASQSVAC
jgi:hypothetical protein